MGQNPVAAVATMARIIETAETGRKTGSSAAAKWAGRQSGKFSRALCEAAAWGAEPLVHLPCESTEQMVKTGERALLEAGISQPGEMIVLMAGKLSGLGLSRSVKLHEVGDGEGQQ